MYYQINTMSKTKQKIIATAVQQFNEKGISNVSQMNIAQAAGISQGNLTYHFKKLPDLMAAIHEQMVQEMDGVIRPLGLVGLEYFEQALLYFFQFQEKYRFFFLDTVQIFRMYPNLIQRHNAIIKRRKEEGRALINYYIGGGWLIPEPEVGIYNVVTQNIWFVNTFWLSMQTINQHQNSKIHAIEMVWTQLKPYFTEKGKADFLKLKKDRSNHE